MSALWTSDEAGAATGGRSTSQWEASGISIDTRTIKRGELFVALKGNSDGHDHVAAALAGGAAAALVARVPDGVSPAAPLLIVADTQKALEDLGRASRARSSARIIAVTGSAGKTTAKEMLRTLLTRFGSVSASSASYNNHWGVPLSLARMPKNCQYGVFEVGMNHAGEIRALIAQVRPEIAIVTTVAPAHLANFGSVEKIADAKAEIFEGLTANRLAIVPAENSQTERLIQRARAVGVASIQTFGAKPGSDAQLLDMQSSAGRQVVSARIGGKELRFGIAADGTHIAHNALAALLAVRALGLDVEIAAPALEEFSALGGRGARFSAGGVEVIDESYNANPASMTAALDLMGRAQPGAGGRRIAVLGDMLELGAGGVALHRAIAADLAQARTDLVFLCGPQMAALWNDIPVNQRGAHAETSTALSAPLLAALKPGDVVLVKGSFGSKMAVIISALKSRDAVPARA